MPRLSGLFVTFTAILLSLFLFFPFDSTASNAGETLTDIVLPLPEEPAYRSYLGLGQNEQFRIGDIKSDVVIIEIFSMYCPYCQAEAPSVNKLYEAIEASPTLKGKIKIIGIGAGNTRFEVDFFRTKYNIPFPLFPDENYQSHKALGKVGTPFFIVVRQKTDGPGEVVHKIKGSFGDVESYLNKIKESAGIN